MALNSWFFYYFLIWVLGLQTCTPHLVYAVLGLKLRDLCVQGRHSTNLPRSLAPHSIYIFSSAARFFWNGLFLCFKAFQIKNKYDVSYHHTEFCDITICNCFLFLYSCLETQLSSRMVSLQVPLLWILPEAEKLVSGWGEKLELLVSFRERGQLELQIIFDLKSRVLPGTQGEEALWLKWRGDVLGSFNFVNIDDVDAQWASWSRKQPWPSESQKYTYERSMKSWGTCTKNNWIPLWALPESMTWKCLKRVSGTLGKKPRNRNGRCPRLTQHVHAWVLFFPAMCRTFPNI